LEKFFVSQCTEYESRIKYFKEQHKKWIDQKVEENERKRQQEKLEEELYAKQAFEINRMRFRTLLHQNNKLDKC